MAQAATPAIGAVSPRRRTWPRRFVVLVAPRHVLEFTGNVIGVDGGEEIVG